MRNSIPLLILLTAAACTAARPGPDVFVSAEQAILAAEQAGAAELAPVQLQFARERLELARRGLENKKYDAMLYVVEQSEINAELAIEQSRTVKARRKVNELRRSNEVLREELENTYGEGFE